MQALEALRMQKDSEFEQAQVPAHVMSLLRESALRKLVPAKRASFLYVQFYMPCMCCVWQAVGSAVHAPTDPEDPHW